MTQILCSTQCALSHPGMLRCECSESLCRESSCFTNYMCFRDVQYIETGDYLRVRLGCLDDIPEVNLSGMAVCNGLLDTLDYRLACCDEEDMCNLVLDVTLPTETPKTPTSNTVTPTDPTDPTDSTGRSPPQLMTPLFCIGTPDQFVTGEVLQTVL